MDLSALLLADPSPNLRRLALLDLLGRAEDDEEVRELEAQRLEEPVVRDLLALQQPDGAWSRNYQMDGWGAGPVQSTALALMRLGYLGFGAELAAVQRGAEYLFAQQQADGGWPAPGQRDEDEEDEGAGSDGYAVRSLQTSLPLRGLAACGYASDARAERGYAWLLGQRLPDGAWPTGITRSGNYGRVAGYRRLAHSRWGCRSNTTGALICLALHPTRCRSAEARAALDLLLGRETREEFSVGYETARLVGAEEAHGFTTFYARFDLGLLLNLCSRVGASLEDERVRDLAEFIRGLRGKYGLWEYARKRQVSRWVTLDLLRSFAGLSAESADWFGLEPRTPFRPYPRQERRF